MKYSQFNCNSYMTNNHTIRCIVLDDEPLAVKLLADYIAKTPGMELVLATTHVFDALQSVQDKKCDLLFLDIQMPELTGIQFMKIIRNSCHIILTTAYQEYAFEGFEHDVIDYLLKPITFERFMTAVQKAKMRISEGVVTTAIQKDDHIFIRTEYRIQKINLADIFFIEGLRDYIAFHTSTGKILSLESMKHMEEVLPQDQFIRSHKSYIINKNKIDFIEKGRLVINKIDLPIGDMYKEKLMAGIRIV